LNLKARDSSHCAACVNENLDRASNRPAIFCRVNRKIRPFHEQNRRENKSPAAPSARKFVKNFTNSDILMSLISYSLALAFPFSAILRTFSLPGKRL
jgi:hypothetical protein